MQTGLWLFTETPIWPVRYTSHYYFLFIKLCSIPTTKKTKKERKKMPANVCTLCFLLLLQPRVLPFLTRDPTNSYSNNDN